MTNIRPRGPLAPPVAPQAQPSAGPTTPSRPDRFDTELVPAAPDRAPRPASAIGIQAPPSPSAAFDPGRELVRLGIRPIATTPARIDAAALLRAGDGGTVRFSYPNRQDPARPTEVVLVPHDRADRAASHGRHTVADPRVMTWLEATEAGTARNFENTDLAALRARVEAFVVEHPDVARALGVTDLRELTPTQAANLAGYLAVDQMRYHYSALRYEGSALYHPAMDAARERLRTIDPELAQRIAAGEPTDASASVRAMDRIGVEQLLANGDAEDGVCRNYTEVFQAVWQTLTDLQDPQRTQLGSSYVKFPMGDFHIWVALYTVQPDGSLLGTQIDPTWADAGHVAPADIQASLSGSGAGFSSERARFALNDLHLEVNGATKAQILGDYYAVWLVSHDLAAQGRPEDGAQLFARYLATLPEVTRADLTVWTEHGLIDPALAGSTGWKRPGAEALARALAPLLRELPIS